MTFSNNSCLVCGAIVFFDADTSLLKWREKVCQRFKVLVSRFLNFDCRMGSDSQTLNINSADNPNKEESVCCFTCFPAIESFCDIYKHWECLQLELFHSLEKISQRTTSSSNNFKEEFIQKAETKRRQHYPYLQLSKLKKSEIPSYLNPATTSLENEAVDVYQDEDDDSIHSENEMPTHLSATTAAVKVEAVYVYQHEDDDSINFPDFSDPIAESFNTDITDTNNIGESQNLEEQQEKVTCESNENATISNVSNDYEDYCIGKVQCDTKEESNKKSKPATLKCKKRGGRINHCIICDKVFPFPCDLIGHIQWHIDEKPFHCRICQREFRKNDNLSAHIKSIHGIRPRVECNTCGKFVKNIYSHDLDVHGPKIMKCPICGKGFPSQCLLNRHLTVHSEHRNFTCDICHRTFKFKHNMCRHKKKLHMMPS